jgi:hypothetical protein
MQTSDVTMVNDACAAMAKVARRSIERHEARIAELKRLLAVVEQVGAAESIERPTNDDKASADVLRTALERVNREEVKGPTRVAG